MAGQLRVYRRRIRSVQATKKITRAMELIAASRIVKAQQRVAESTPYAEAITRAVSAVASYAGNVDHPLTTEKEQRNRAALLLLTADRGLAGAYSSNAIREGERLSELLRSEGKEVRPYLVGRKAISYYRFRGREIAGLPGHQVAELGIAQSPEGRRVFPRMTVLENLEMGAFTRNDEHIRADIDRVYELFPRLKERERQKAGTMSGGEQQMLAIGRALMANPKLLLLDEPSLGLAPVIVDRIYEIIREINHRGVTILLVEQNANYALDVSNRGYVLETGKVVLSNASAALRHDPEVQKAYLGT